MRVTNDRNRNTNESVTFHRNRNTGERQEGKSYPPSVLSLVAFCNVMGNTEIQCFIFYKKYC